MLALAAVVSMVKVDVTGRNLAGVNGGIGPMGVISLLL